VNVAPETCRGKKRRENKLDLLHLVGILFITIVVHVDVYFCIIVKKKVKQSDYMPGQVLSFPEV
jgi:hypothetical protein